MTAQTASWPWDRRGWTGVALAAVGLIDSVYLTWLKLADATAACAGIGDCDTVNNSRFASVGGIPIAILGALSYGAILALLFVDRLRPEWRLPSRVAMFGLTLAGTLYSAYLTYVELAVLRAVCPFCVVSAVAMTLLLVISILRLRESD